MNFEGDRIADDCTVTAEIQRDYSVNPSTGVRSKDQYCWFSVQLNVRAPGGALLYSDRWSIKFDDMGLLLETHGAKDPEVYFSRFFVHSAYFTNGVRTSSPKGLVIQKQAIESSLRFQGTRTDPAKVAAELRSLESVRQLIYRGDWKEDLRVVAYVPSLRRGAIIQLGYQGADD